MEMTARRAATATLVAGGIVVAALALWKIRVVIALFFLGMTVAAAMRPGVDWLNRRAHLPRSAGVLVHVGVLAGVIALFLWLVVPRAITQVQQAVGSVPTTSAELAKSANNSTGIKHTILAGLEKRLKRLPSGSGLVHPAVTVTTTAFEALVGLFFVFAVAAYWVFERDRFIPIVQSLVPAQQRRLTRDTWVLIDQKLGAFVRGQLILIGFVALVLSTGFYAVGLHFWLLIGSFAGVVEIVPVIGPLAAAVLAIGVGLTQSWHVALFAGVIVLAVRQVEDYVIVPRVLGHAVGLSPLVVLVSVTSIGILLGPFYVLLAIPIAAVAATLVDVVLRNVDPADEDVPAVIFTASDAEG
jgi:predicted PurR-regulated permease PerM